MRQIVYNRWLLPVLWCLAVVACDDASSLDYAPEEPHGQISIRMLKAQAAGEVTILSEELVIEGVVTANDHYGEFRRQLVVEDDSGGIALSLDHTALYKNYPCGCRLRIRCNGLLLYNYGGRIELGATADAYGSVALSPLQIDRHVERLAVEMVTPAPRLCTLASLCEQDIDCYVRLDGVRFLERATWCEPDVEQGGYLTTERTIEDAEGCRLVVRTLGSAHYADEPLPEGRGSLCGIVSYFGGSYALRVSRRGFFF